jgi:hypothetical protein
MADGKHPTYLSYLLRIWRDHQRAPWRASLESTATGNVYRFADVEGLWTFLLAQMEGENNDPVAPPEGAP